MTIADGFGKQLGIKYPDNQKCHVSDQQRYYENSTRYKDLCQTLAFGLAAWHPL